jgi:hypothetical protein
MGQSDLAASSHAGGEDAMARVLLLGTWLKRPWPEEAEVKAAGEGVQIGGMSSQMLLTGRRIVVRRPWIVDERTWKHGMARSVQEGRIEELSDEQLVVVDAPEGSGRRG